MIDLVGLAALQAVERHGSVVAAAAAAGYTPSGVSQQIKRLERQAGVALLERVGRNVVLTAAGRHLVARGAGVLAEIETIQAELQRAAASITGDVRLGAMSTAMRGIVAPAVGALRRQYPDLVVGLSECEPWEAVEQVGTGALDMAVVHSWGDVPLVIPDHLTIVALGDDIADVIVPTGHRICCGRGDVGDQGTVSPRDLLDERWVATPTGTICRQWLERMYLGTDRSPRVTHEALEYQSHLALVAAGLGIALIPRLGRGPLPDGVVAIGVDDPLPFRSISLIHRKAAAASPITEAIRSALVTHAPA